MSRKHAWFKPNIKITWLERFFDEEYLKAMNEYYSNENPLRYLELFSRFD